MHERKVRYLTGIYFYDTAGTVPVILQKNDVMSTSLMTTNFIFISHKYI